MLFVKKNRLDFTLEFHKISLFFWNNQFDTLCELYLVLKGRYCTMRVYYHEIEIFSRFGVTFCFFELFSRLIKNSLNKEHEWDTVLFQLQVVNCFLQLVCSYLQLICSVVYILFVDLYSCSQFFRVFAIMQTTLKNSSTHLGRSRLA